ncbi:YhfC family glutamic-type intramembrane protease [Virgibacillus halophilus]|uniref:YhfC family glutamic-type intramembrane protease n=1 Tax=Tigheibacillus halophilus TaxID=361280 RepID=A0ABU5C4D2_9BACI|nr:YhfC family glutamic-type intramembrane protease [Virgibacillus halophilus]
MVDSLAITFLMISVMLAIGVPVAFLIFFHRRFTVSWKHVLVGAGIFIVFALILEKMLHAYVLDMNPVTMKWVKNPYFYALYGGLAAGVFEEVGRFIGFRYILQKSHDWEDGISYGIGHGGI